MSTRERWGLVALGCLFVMVACSVFAALAGAMVLSGEVPLYAPRLVGVQPWTHYAFQPTTPLTFTFDQPMNAASFETAFSLDPAVPGTFRWNQSRNQVTFVPDRPGYEPGTAYTVSLAPGVKAGTLPRTTKRGTEWGFSLAPLVDTSIPPLGQGDLGPWTQLQVAFNYPLDCDSTLQTFSITPETVGQVECHGRTLAFNPTEPLEPDTAYVADLGQVYLQDDPSARPGVRWEFRTAPPLVVADILPAEGGSVLGLRTPFRIAFNRPVVPDSVLSRFSLAPEGGPQLAGQVTWEEGGARFVFQPAEPLRPATRYRLVLRAGVQDELGFQVAEELDRSFETAPMVGLPLPVPGATNVTLDSPIRIPFTRPMDKASVEAGLVFSPSLEGKVTWEEDTLVFTPRGSLAPQTNYVMALNPDVRDASGAPLAAASRWEFATQPFLLEARVPSAATLMELRRPIELTFALPMDRMSVQAALTVSPTIPGTLSWSADGRSVSFLPDPAWLSGTDYRVILSGAACSADGSRTLGADQTWTFTTGVALVQFGYGPNVQVMDAAGERTFQLIAQGADVADFRLYAITPTQFLDFYSPGLWGTSPRSIDTAGSPLAAAWREALTPWGEGTYAYTLGNLGVAEAHLPADVPPGLYVLSGAFPVASPLPVWGTEEGQGQLLIVLSRHVLELKRALAGTGSRSQVQIVVWDTELSTGAPVVSATVRLYDRQGTFLDEGQTGAGGLVTLDVPGDPGPLLALADRGGDLTVCGLGDEWSEVGWWGGWSQPAGRPLYTTYSYTDRPIYRPGQTVYFKDFVRADDDVSYTLPAPDLPVTVHLYDARDNVAAAQVFTPTQFGTVYGQFQLADEPMLGIWNLETEVESAVIRQPLRVEEYRKPEYEVAVQTPQLAYVQGEAISVTVDAAYYFGQPVGGADVVLTTYLYYPDDYYDEAAVGRFGFPLSSQKGRTDEQGRWLVVVPTADLFPSGSTAQRAALTLEATVTDDSGQSVSSYQMVVVYRTSQGLTLLLDRQGYRPDEEVLFAAQVRDRDGEPVAGAELTAQVLGWDDQEVASATATTDAGGHAHFSVRLTEQGWYTLHVRGTDDRGREMLAEEWLWVYDPGGQAPWYEGRWDKEGNLTVSADRTTYAVGDEARLVVSTPLPGPALLTFERGATRLAKPITLISGTNLITVPIRADYAPNIYVTVSQFGPLGPSWQPVQSWPEAELHQASTQLLVPMADRLLTVTLTADQEFYSPGDEATFHVQVTDSQGRPAVAEVSLAVVDEAIYALVEDLSKDPFEVFYAPRPDLVRTFDSLRPTRGFEYGQGGGGEGGAGGAPRRNFLDTAYWAPAVVTDDSGKATITFRLPDNLAKWRALARAITADTQVGQATTSIVVDKEIVVRPFLPRFLIQGDAITLTAVVHNFTSQAVSATVSLDLEGLVRTGEPGSQLAWEQIVSVPTDGAASVAWPVVAEQPGRAKVTIRVTATYRGARVAGRDAVELLLPVYPLAMPAVATFAGTLTPARPTDTITLSLPADASAGLSRLEINLAPSIAPGLLDGLEYLIEYPFGCVEQTMSRVLPNAMVAQAFRKLGIRNELLEADLPPMVDLGLQKLYGFQHNDGGWGWWYDDGTNVDLTAYVLFGLSMTEQAGFNVDGGVMDRGAKALQGMLLKVDPHAQAYGAYVLAMAGRPFTMTLTLTDALGLDLFSQAALAIALDAGGDPATVNALLDNLRGAAIQDATTVYWSDEGDNAALSAEVMGSTVRTTAMVADTLARLDPESSLLPKAVRWLMARRQGRGWGDTQRTSFAILALSDYLLASQELATGSAFQIYLNDELWQDGRLEQAEAGRVLTVPLSALLPGENRVQLVLGTAGEAPSGRLYYAVTWSVDRVPQEETIPALLGHERSIGVRREYRLRGSQQLAAQFRQGDLVEVRLTLDVPAESWYVVVDDPLPAGFEALNERLGTSSHVAGLSDEPVYTWEEYGYNRKDVRDERVTFFITHLEPGERTFTYLMRAISPGSFTAPPVQIYPMYEPEVWSRSASTRCQVQAR